jgi:hypothetical protein
MNLLDAWANWRPGSAPFVLDGDRETLNSDHCAEAIVTHRSRRKASKAPDFCAPGDRRLHLGLLPQPFLGDVRRATVYILLLNPGLGPDDYYGEYNVPRYRAMLLANLRQEFRGISQVPFLFLNPQFAWHGGWNWWHGKLAGVIDRLASARRISFSEARLQLGSVIASIELVPYHSAVFKDVGGLVRKLRSVDLARHFVTDFVLPRVQSSEAIAIVTRKVAAWNLPEHRGVVTYSSGQARAAHLTPDSPGGRAILRHLRVLV